MAETQALRQSDPLLVHVGRRQEFADYLLGLGSYGFRATPPESEQIRRLYQVLSLLRQLPVDQETAVLRIAAMILPSHSVLSALLVAAYREYVAAPDDWRTMSDHALFAVASQHHQLADFLSFSGLFAPLLILPETPITSRAGDSQAPLHARRRSDFGSALQDIQSTRAMLFTDYYRSCSAGTGQTALRLVLLCLLEGQDRQVAAALAVGHLLSRYDPLLGGAIRRRLLLAVQRGDLLGQSSDEVDLSLRLIAALADWDVLEALPYLREMDGASTMTTQAILRPHLRRAITRLASLQRNLQSRTDTIG